MKWNAIASLVLLLAACATHEPRCDSALRPINIATSHSLSNAPAAPPR